jgi:hypothetical protein
VAGILRQILPVEDILFGGAMLVFVVLLHGFAMRMITSHVIRRAKVIAQHPTAWRADALIAAAVFLLGGDLRFGHPSGEFTLHTEPNLDKNPNGITHKTLSFPRTARIICDGTVYIKEARRSAQATWTEADEVTAASFFMLGDNISVQR